MRVDITLESVISLRYNEEKKYSSLKASKVVEVSFDIIRSINVLSKDCWSDLSTQYAIYRQNLAYYRRYGGVCPTLEYQLAYKEKINKLKEIKDFILDSINSIKDNKWTYDIGYCKYIRGLREILKLNV